MRIIPIALIALAALCPLTAPEIKPKDVREAAKAGSAAIPKLQEFLKNPSSDVRNQAVRQPRAHRRHRFWPAEQERLARTPAGRRQQYRELLRHADARDEQLSSAPERGRQRSPEPRRSAAGRCD